MGGCLRVSRGLYKGGQVKNGTIPKSSALSEELRGMHTHIGSGRVLSGRGAGCSCDPLARDRVYFEVRVRSRGSFAVGLTTRPQNPQRDLDREIGDIKTFFGLKSEMLAAVPEPGDVVGVFVDSSSSAPRISFALNGLPLSDLYDIPRPMSELKIPKEPLFPVIYVNRGGMVEASFKTRHWAYPPSDQSGYQEHVVMVQDLAIT